MGIILILGFLCALFQTHGIILSDEGEYAYNAFEIAKGTFENGGHHFENRFGLLMPIAASLKLFGTKYWVFFLWSFVCFWALIITNFYFLRTFSFKLAFYSSLLFAISPIFSWLALDIAPDLVMTTFIWMAVLGTFHFRNTQQNEAFGGFLVGLLFIHIKND